MIFGRSRKNAADRSSEPELRCSFCNKAQNEVRKLIAGPTVFICDECVQVCNDIIADDDRFANRRIPPAAEPPASETPQQPSGSRWMLRMTCALCSLPVLVDEALGIEERGFLCVACADAVEAALAERKATS